jgi:hypothetical protein
MEKAIPLLSATLKNTNSPTVRKEVAVYENLYLLIKKFSAYLDESLLRFHLCLQAGTNNEFLEERSVRHLTRLVCSHYFIYKKLTRSLQLFPEERHLVLRVMPVSLQFPFETKSVLGLAIGICPLGRYELFDEKHILMAVQQCMPSAAIVPGSFYISQHPQDPIRLLYLELQKSFAGRFSVSEIQALKQTLISQLKVRVEKLLPALFMTRNEEEVLKTILILGQELQHADSLPQVTISFESQSQTELFYCRYC